MLHKLEDMFNLLDTSSKIYECTGTIEDKSYDNDTVVKMISELINNTYDISDKDNIYTIELKKEENESPVEKIIQKRPNCSRLICRKKEQLHQRT